MNIKLFDKIRRYNNKKSKNYFSFCCEATILKNMVNYLKNVKDWSFDSDKRFIYFQTNIKYNKKEKIVQISKDKQVYNPLSILSKKKKKKAFKRALDFVKTKSGKMLENNSYYILIQNQTKTLAHYGGTLIIPGLNRKIFEINKQAYIIGSLFYYLDKKRKEKIKEERKKQEIKEKQDLEEFLEQFK